MLIRVVLPSHVHKEKRLTRADLQHHGQPCSRGRKGIVAIAFQVFSSHWHGHSWWADGHMIGFSVMPLYIKQLRWCFTGVLQNKNSMNTSDHSYYCDYELAFCTRGGCISQINRNNLLWDYMFLVKNEWNGIRSSWELRKSGIPACKTDRPALVGVSSGREWMPAEQPLGACQLGMRPEWSYPRPPSFFLHLNSALYRRLSFATLTGKADGVCSLI